MGRQVVDDDVNVEIGRNALVGRITFLFGLVHGFGFAGALREIGLPRAQLPIVLVSFNLGIEVGQLGVLSILLRLTLAAPRGSATAASRS